METKDKVRQTLEGIVVQWLANKGYRTNIGMCSANLVCIEAEGVRKNLLILVTPFMRSNGTGFIPYDEMREIQSQAVRHNYETYEASIYLDDNLQQVGRIKWKRL